MTLPIDAPMGQAVAFLAALAGRAEAESAAVPMTFQTFDDEKPGGQSRPMMARLLHGPLAHHQADLDRLNAAGAGVFVAVNGTDGRGRRKVNVRTLRAWWCDVDMKGAREPLDLSRLPLMPSTVVRTPGGWHLYWIAKAPMPCGDDGRKTEHEAEVKAIARDLAPFGGDLKACDVARVLRVPGFLHRKGEPSPVTLEWADGPRYTREQIRAAFPLEEPKQATEAARPEWLAPPQRSGILNRAAAYLDKLPQGIAGQGGHAATFDAALKIVSGFDLTEDEALSLMMERFNPRCVPPWSEDELRHKVQDASAHAKNRGRLLDESHNRISTGGRKHPASPSSGSHVQGAVSDSDPSTMPPPGPEGCTSNAALAGGHEAAAKLPAVPGFTWRAQGLFRVTIKPGKDGEPPKDEAEWIAPPFTLPGLMRDELSRGWRLLIAWKDLDGTPQEEAVPFDQLSGEGLELGRILGQGGLMLPPEVSKRKLLLRYLCLALPSVQARVRLVEALGWHEGSFILPSGESLGTQAGEPLRFAGEPDRRAASIKGTLEGWQSEVARYGVGNPRLAFGLACAFAGPLLALVRPDGGGGFNLQGFSSKGKSTILEAAASVWNRPDPLPTWRATSNGLEGIAAARNDGFLVLDELSQVDAKEAGQVAYMLANGAAKARATREGGNRVMRQWRLIFLSSGEQGLEDKLSEDGKKVRAGQEVRVPDIPCPPSGMLDDAHRLPNPGALAEHLKAQARRHYGHAARAFLKGLCDQWERREALQSKLREMEAAWLAEQVPAGADPQVRRVAGRFALVAVAGELAQRMGILPWPEGEASQAAAVCFGAWLDRRGHAGASEVHRGIAAVRAFLEKHGMARFDEWGDRDAKPINRAGTRKRAEGPVDGWDFFILPEAWKEASQGFGAREVARACADAGILEPDGAGKLARSIQIPGHGKARYYIIRAASVARHLEGEGE